MLIGLCGYARSGKDEFYKAVCGENTARLAFADKVKQDIQELLSKHYGDVFDVCHTDSHKSIWRPLLVAWGNDCRKIDAAVWINRLVMANKALLKDDAITKYVTDVRYLNEAEWIINSGGILVLINREGNKANNETELATIDEIKRKLTGQYKTLYNPGDDLDAYHHACRAIDSEIRKAQTNDHTKT